jgi:hypothetical protein
MSTSVHSESMAVRVTGILSKSGHVVSPYWQIDKPTDRMSCLKELKQTEYAGVPSKSLYRSKTLVS